MIPLISNDFQWGRSEVVIYPDIFMGQNSTNPHHLQLGFRHTGLQAAAKQRPAALRRCFLQRLVGVAGELRAEPLQRIGDLGGELCKASLGFFLGYIYI